MDWRPKQIMKIASFLSNLTTENHLEMLKYKITGLKLPKAYYKKLQCNNGGIRVGTWLANHRNNSFATKIRRQQGSQKLSTHYV
jgi:hypothetical protein